MPSLLLAASVPFLTPDGWGKVRIGMSQAQVARALGAKLRGEPLDDEMICVEKVAGPYPGMWFMFEEGRLSRISVGEKSKVTTPRRIAPDAAAEQVRKAYPKGLRAQAHYYLQPPAEYLTYWTVARNRGVRFETDLKRRVQTIHAGTDSIELVEGCA